MIRSQVRRFFLENHVDLLKLKYTLKDLITKIDVRRKEYADRQVREAITRTIAEAR